MKFKYVVISFFLLLIIVSEVFEAPIKARLYKISNSVRYENKNFMSPSETPNVTKLDQPEYYFESDLVVERDAALVVYPGTKLMFAKGKKLIIYGHAEFSGTDKAPIILTSMDSKNSWGGIIINGRSTASFPELILDTKSTENLNSVSQYIEKFGEIFLSTQGNSIQVIFQHVNLENIYTDKNFNGDGMPAIEIKNSVALFKQFQFHNIQGGPALDIEYSRVIVHEGHLESCKTHSILEINNSYIYINQTTIQPSCLIDAQSELGPIALEGITGNRSYVQMYRSKFKDILDDAIDMNDSNLIIYKNEFEKIGDNPIDVKKSQLIALGNRANSEKGFSTVMSSGIFINNSITSTTACQLIKNSSKVWDINTDCNGPKSYMFIFDFRRCLRQGDCKNDETIRKKSYDLLKRFDSRISNEDFDAMINYGGKYKDILNENSPLFNEIKKKYAKDYYLLTDCKEPIRSTEVMADMKCKSFSKSETDDLFKLLEAGAP